VEVIKLVILFFLLLTMLVFWLWVRNIHLTLLLFAALLLNSMGLAYIDIFFAPGLVLALWMLKERRWGWFSLFYGITCLIKWQPVLIAPFIALYILGVDHPRQWREIEPKRLLLSILPAGAVLGLVVFIFHPTPVWQAFQASLSHQYLSGNALNFNWILTHFLRVFSPDRFGGLVDGTAGYIMTDDPAISLAPRLLFILSYLAVWVVFFFRAKTFRNLLLYSIVGFFAYFTFNTGVHENHLFLLMVLIVALVWVDRSFQMVSLVLILINNINLFLFYGVDGNLHFPRPVIGVDIALLLAIFNLAFFLYLFLKMILRRFDQPGDGISSTPIQGVE
jgi:hypothetical protein